ncbi:MAG: ribosome maturation factor RimM [Candidatus Muiribacteriota bacterium]
MNLETYEELNKDFVQIGFVSKTFGLKGGLRIFIYPEFFYLFENKVEFLYVKKNRLEVNSFSVKSYKHIKIFFENINTLNEAQKLINNSIYLKKEELFSELKDSDNDIKGTYTIEELKGFKVINQLNKVQGTVESFYSNRFCSYIVLNNEELIPFIKEHIKEVNLKEKIINIYWQKDEEY